MFAAWSSWCRWAVTRCVRYVCTVVWSSNEREGVRWQECWGWVSQAHDIKQSKDKGTCYITNIICYPTYIICYPTNIICPTYIIYVISTHIICYPTYIICYIILHISYVILHISYVNLHISYVILQISYAILHISYVILILQVNISAHSEAVNTRLVGSLIGFGCLSVVLIGALVYMIHRARRPRSDQPWSDSA
jgi:hypothetical protein